MKDKELLELAAKAAGIKPDSWDDCGWSPLSDDGDALRLAVKLGISLFLEPCRSKAGFIEYGYLTNDTKGHIRVHPVEDGDYMSAVRSAITKAAAEIGREME